MPSIFPPILSLVLSSVFLLPVTATADEPITLLGTIVKWRYPDAEIGKSEMSDAATINADGKRTIPSTLLKTTMATPDSVGHVLAFYRELLKRNPSNDKKLGITPHVGQSVVFSDESEGCPFDFHTIVVNSESSSTTLIITRGKNEDRTRITWKHYVKHEVRGQSTRRD